jgi:PAS domain S-box-containing protein
MLNEMMERGRNLFQNDLTFPKDMGLGIVPKDKRARIFRNQLHGTCVRTVGMFIIGAFAVFCHVYGAISYASMVGILLSLAGMVILQVPLLAIIWHTSRKFWYEIWSLAINIMEILGYTSFIYFGGGLRVTFLTPIYVNLIYYVGTFAPKRYPFILAGCSSLAFSSMLVLEHLGILPHQVMMFEYKFTGTWLFLVDMMICALFFVVAFMSYSSASAITEARIRLKRQNIELERANGRLTEEVEDRKRAYKALRESEDKLHDIFDNVPDGLFTHDLNGVFLETNLAMRLALGYGEDEPLPPDFSLKGIIPSQYFPLVDRYLYEIQKKGKGEGIIRVTEKSGKSRIIEFKNSLISDASGKPVGIRGAARDITERHQAEKERIKLLEQLQQAKKMEALGTLAGGVAHDLNNILSGIISYPELLLMETPEESPLRKPLVTIKKSGEKAASIVQDLLTLARRGVAVSEKVDLDACVRDYLKSPEYEMLLSRHPKVEMSLGIQEGLHAVAGSPVHIAKTVMNLVTNAVESMPEGGRIVIEASNTVLDEPLKGFDNFRKGQYVVLRVTDTGVGMSEKDRERIFDPFYTKKVMGRSGTGLGLTVVWGTVKDMGGHIDVQSFSGQGSVFTLYFPAQPGGKAQAGGEKAAIDYRGNGEQILVVDDSEDQRDIATRILSMLGYHVRAVSCGERAVEYLGQNAVDLVLLDMIMTPGIDGLETYRRILEFHPQQKAIIVSGYSETERVKEAQKLGAGAYIRKPYLMEKIGIAIKQELAR